MSNPLFSDVFHHKRPDGGKHSAPHILCYITLASNRVFQVEVDHKADGQEVISKMCKMLGITEECDYFGMQFTGSKNELLWINNRNRLSKQINGSSPYHLYLRVKYFVPPHVLQIEETRHQFYMSVVQHLKSGFWDAESSVKTQAQLIALMAYVQFGNYNPNTTPCKYACFWPECRGEMTAEALSTAANFHQELKGLTVSLAKLQVLNTVYNEFSLYGTHLFDIKDVFDHKLIIAVGPNDLVLCNNTGSILERYPYCRIHTVTNSGRVVTLCLLEDDGSVKNHNFQLISVRLANALYRLITETHAFFHGDTIRSNLLSQTTRDSAVFAAMFDHTGKEYAFDVRYTYLEVLDRANRRMYRCANEIKSVLLDESGDPLPNNGSNSNEIPNTSVKSATSNVNSDEVEEMVEERLREVAVCRVCMTELISRVFFPCGHTICCADCSERVNLCPICRKQIDFRHPCFLPWGVESNNNKNDNNNNNNNNKSDRPNCQRNSRSSSLSLISQRPMFTNIGNNDKKNNNNRTSANFPVTSSEPYLMHSDLSDSNQIQSLSDIASDSITDLAICHNTQISSDTDDSNVVNITTITERKDSYLPCVNQLSTTSNSNLISNHLDNDHNHDHGQTTCPIDHIHHQQSPPVQQSISTKSMPNSSREQISCPK